MSGAEVLKAVFGIDVDTAWQFQIGSDLVALADGRKNGLVTCEARSGFRVCQSYVAKAAGCVAMAEGLMRGLAKAENWFMTYAAAPYLSVARRVALFNLNAEVIWFCSLSPISGLIADV
tara:strand:+ start:3903 stop:4259 length:357 start_codon:yes stop_codon:yes gene_type:complete